MSSNSCRKSTQNRSIQFGNFNIILMAVLCLGFLGFFNSTPASQEPANKEPANTVAALNAEAVKA
ncbi:MAG: hypothetical protein ACREAC_25345, partial [Blastocatellia bacterium]